MLAFSLLFGLTVVPPVFAWPGFWEDEIGTDDLQAEFSLDQLGKLIVRLDTNKDGSMSLDEWTAAVLNLSARQQLDRARSEIVQMEGFSDGKVSLESVGAQLEHTAGFDKSTVGRDMKVLRACDVGADGFLDEAEWVACRLPHIDGDAASERAAPIAMAVFGAGRDGELSQAEAHTALMWYGGHKDYVMPFDEFVAVVLSDADSDKSGGLSVGELRGAIRRRADARHTAKTEYDSFVTAGATPTPEAMFARAEEDYAVRIRLLDLIEVMMDNIPT